MGESREEDSRRKRLTVLEKLEIPELKRQHIEDQKWLSKQHETPDFERKYMDTVIAVCDRRVIYYSGSYDEVLDWLGENLQEGIPIIHVVAPDTVYLAA